MLIAFTGEALWACLKKFGSHTKGLPLHPHHKMGVYAVYIISKAGGLIYSLDNQKPPTEVQLLCKYPPSFVLEEGDRGVMVKFGEEGGVKGISIRTDTFACC